MVQNRKDLWLVVITRQVPSTKHWSGVRKWPNWFRAGGTMLLIIVLFWAQKECALYQKGHRTARNYTLFSLKEPDVLWKVTKPLLIEHCRARAHISPADINDWLRGQRWTWRGFKRQSGGQDNEAGREDTMASRSRGSRGSHLLCNISNCRPSISDAAHCSCPGPQCQPSRYPGHKFCQGQRLRTKEVKEISRTHHL